MRENMNSGRLYRHFTDRIWRPLMASTKWYSSKSSRFVLVFVSIFLGAFVSTRLLDSSVISITSNSPKKSILTARTSHIYPHKTPGITEKPLRNIEIPLNCSLGNRSRTCPANYYPSSFHVEDQDRQSTPSPTCPDYFRWIYEDLRPWRETGITEEMMERARITANFRLVILNGRVYVEMYRRTFPSRETFTLWGFLQLLRRYPGKVPDLDLMFDTADWPIIKKKYFIGPNATSPPPLFKYCRDDNTLDIVFPDWSFWGWPEINIKPWDGLLNELKEGNKRSRWIDREPYAFWKGNAVVAPTRMDLLKCNVSEKQDWNARIYAQDWIKESEQGFKQSDLTSQCIHRYKIYIEGSAWSVSEKYILACDSVTLLVKPRYFDFFTRGLMPGQHYWPIKDDGKCRSIKFAVDWGNNHKEKAQEIGKAGSKFIQHHLTMDYVYDYMFHLLNAYSKLLKYKPTVPPKAAEICSDEIACRSEGLNRKYMEDSLVKGPSELGPCSMPPPYDPVTLQSLIRRKEDSIRQIEEWEKEFWDDQTKT